MYKEVRNFLLTEAQQSPQLLSDLAGLEAYVAESYDSRSFIELLQNADDAKSQRFFITRVDNFLIVANDGNEFSPADLEAICRSAASNKERGSSIGYRGIGFKSVVGFASEVHIISGNMEITFSRELTAKEIPNASRVPLIRIPHPIDPKIAKIKDHVLALRSDGYKTLFIFSGITGNAIENEFRSFDPSSMLFLRNVRKLYIRGGVNESYEVVKKELETGFEHYTLKSDNNTTNWIIASQDDVSVAFYQNPESESIERLAEKEAVVHAFLPTHEATGLGVKVNGDFSTDPSRTRVVFDERTKDQISKIAKLISSIVTQTLANKNKIKAKEMFSSLIPNEDPRLHAHQKRAFKTELCSAIKCACTKQVEKISINPAWLNNVDFSELCSKAEIITAPKLIQEINGAVDYLRFLGAKEVKLARLISSIPASTLTKQGCAEITAELIRLHDTKQLDTEGITSKLPILYTEAGRASIHEAESRNSGIDRDYLDLVTERSGGTSGLRRLVKSIAGDGAASKLIPNDITTEVAPSDSHRDIFRTFKPQSSGVKSKSLSLKKWRGAEEQLRNILEANGFIATDVSRQNIGYDLECHGKNGERLFIEVKLIETPTQPFIMTSNEEAVARMKGDSYLIALIKQGGDSLEVSFIPNPVKNLELTRQCRQWVWECSTYPYNPTLYEIVED